MIVVPSAARSGTNAASLRSCAYPLSTTSAIGPSSWESSRKGPYSPRRFQRRLAGPALACASREPPGPLEVGVVERDVRHPGRVAVVVALRKQAADVDAVGELHAQLERPQAEVDAQHVVHGAVFPGLGRSCEEARFARVHTLGVRGLDDAAEIEADDARDAAEEREPDEEIEREGQLALSHVIGVAQQPGVVEAEPAQVVERAEEEVPPEPVALRVTECGAGRYLGAREQPDRMDRVRLPVAEQAVRPALGQGPGTHGQEHRGTADRSEEHTS